MRLVTNKKLSGFENTVVDGINIFYNSSLPETYKSLTVKLENFLFLKTLEAEGEDIHPNQKPSGDF